MAEERKYIPFSDLHVAYDDGQAVSENDSVLFPVIINDNGSIANKLIKYSSLGISGVETDLTKIENRLSTVERDVDEERTERTEADTKIKSSLEAETTARLINDELLQEQINEVAVQTDWNQDDDRAMDYLKNRPTAITDAEIEALFI